MSLLYPNVILFVLLGSEIEVMSDLLVSGSLEHINVTMIEFHPSLAESEERRQNSINLEAGLKVIEEVTRKFQILNIDDEAFFDSDFALPQC